MATAIKFKKIWDAEEDSQNAPNNQSNSAPFQEGLIGYKFLRNVWGTYFFDRQKNFTSEDKIDSINKIVGMMKAQIKLMILNETKQNTEKQNWVNFEKQSQAELTLHGEINELRQELERSKMKQQDFYVLLQRESHKVLCLESQNRSLRAQVQELKQAKNKAYEHLIALSSKCYELQRFNTTPSLNFRANSVELEDKHETPKVSLFGRKDSKIIQKLCQDIGSLHSEQDIYQHTEQIQELNLNLNLVRRNPMKQSLPINFRDDVNQQSHRHFLEEMKLMKLKTERIIGIENQRAFQKPFYRKTLQSYTDRPLLDTPIKLLKEKRFKRVR